MLLKCFFFIYSFTLLRILNAYDRGYNPNRGRGRPPHDDIDIYHFFDYTEDNETVLPKNDPCDNYYDYICSTDLQNYYNATFHLPHEREKTNLAIEFLRDIFEKNPLNLTFFNGLSAIMNKSLSQRPPIDYSFMKKKFKEMHPWPALSNKFYLNETGELQYLVSKNLKKRGITLLPNNYVIPHMIPIHIVYKTVHSMFYGIVAREVPKHYLLGENFQQYYVPIEKFLSKIYNSSFGMGTDIEIVPLENKTHVFVKETDFFVKRGLQRIIRLSYSKTILNRFQRNYTIFKLVEYNKHFKYQIYNYSCILPMAPIVNFKKGLRNASIVIMDSNEPEFHNFTEYLNKTLFYINITAIFEELIPNELRQSLNILNIPLMVIRRKSLEERSVLENKRRFFRVQDSFYFNYFDILDFSSFFDYAQYEFADLIHNDFGFYNEFGFAFNKILIENYVKSSQLKFVKDTFDKFQTEYLSIVNNSNTNFTQHDNGASMLKSMKLTFRYPPAFENNTQLIKDYYSLLDINENDSLQVALNKINLWSRRRKFDYFDPKYNDYYFSANSGFQITYDKYKNKIVIPPLLLIWLDRSNITEVSKRFVLSYWIGRSMAEAFKSYNYLNSNLSCIKDRHINFNNTDLTKLSIPASNEFLSMMYSLKFQNVTEHNEQISETDLKQIYNEFAKIQCKLDHDVVIMLQELGLPHRKLNRLFRGAPHFNTIFKCKNNSFMNTPICATKNK